jgi:hypothetical protein
MLGAQTFDALGERWSLFLGNAAQCAIEEKFDKGFFAVVADAMPQVDAETAMALARSMADGSAVPSEHAERVVTALRGIRVSMLRELAYFGMKRQHQDLTPDQVSEIIDDLGRDRFGDILGRAIRAAQGEEVGDDAKPGKPPRATRPRAPRGKPS